LYHCDEFIYIENFIFQVGREVLGRTVVLRGSSGFLNTESCSFHLVAARETRVAGWYKGELLLSVIQVGACVTGSWCFHPVGVGTLRELVLPSSGC
jgi:hypothetical protein